MSRVEILQKMQLVIQEQMGKEDIVLTEATKLDDLGVDSSLPLDENDREL